MRPRRLLANLFHTMTSQRSPKVRTSNSHIRTSTATTKAPPRTATPAGSNWQALRKVRLISGRSQGFCSHLLTQLRHCFLYIQTLDSDTPAANHRMSKKRRLSTKVDKAPASSIDKGKARQMGSGSHTDDGNGTASPAPTSLPWFAEDLSPEDLALVRNLNLQPDTQSGASAQSQWTAWDVQRGTDQQEEQKKRIILGGHWDGPDNAAKRE